jgi:glycosyltransferase involved in cell wall biosynthesis
VKRRGRICFVSPNAYPVLAGARDIAFVGGAEVQQALIAAELARRGHDVSMISMDFGQTEGARVNGVRLLKMHAPDAGLPFLRFVHPRLTSLWKAMRRADADLYYQRCAGALTGFVARFAKVHGKRAVFAGASDLDFDATLPRFRFARERALYRYGIRHVDQVVVQSERQSQMCSRSFGCDSVRVNSCYEFKGRPGEFGGPIIWVGTVRSIKRPELFLDLAQRLPQFRFRLVGGAAEGDAPYDALKRRALSLGNVEMTGFVPYADVETQFDGASLLVNTSVSEGFPNTFMQAWSRGMPTVSFFDPGASADGVEVGTVVSDLDAMERAVLAFKADPVLWHEHGARAAEHFRQNYTVVRTVDDYERLFQSILPKTGRVQA